MLTSSSQVEELTFTSERYVQSTDTCFDKLGETSSLRRRWERRKFSLKREGNEK